MKLKIVFYYFKYTSPSDLLNRYLTSKQLPQCKYTFAFILYQYLNYFKNVMFKLKIHRYENCTMVCYVKGIYLSFDDNSQVEKDGSIQIFTYLYIKLYGNNNTSVFVITKYV